MATKIYDTKVIELLDNTLIVLKPLKIKHLRNVMDCFDKVSGVQDNEEYMSLLIEAVYYSLQQYCPEKCKNVEYVEDNVTMPMIGDILDIGAGIKINKDKEDGETAERPKSSENKSTWKDLDLLRLETEVFMLGIWKDFDELEENLSMPELIEILNAKRESQLEERKFFAAIQGIDLDKNSSNSAQNKWEEMKARVFSKGATSDPNDILSLQGIKAEQLGFGIGFGLDYDNQLPTKSDSV